VTPFTFNVVPKHTIHMEKLTIDIALRRWSEFIHTSDYRVMRDLVSSAFNEQDGERFIKAEFIQSQVFRDSVFKYLLKMDRHNATLFDKKGVIINPDLFLNEYFNSPFAAFMVLSAAREMEYEANATDAPEIRKYDPAKISFLTVDDDIIQKLITPFVYKPHLAFQNYFTCCLFVSYENLVKWCTALTRTIKTMEEQIEFLSKSKNLRDKHISRFLRYNLSSLDRRGNLQAGVFLSHHAAERPNEYESDPTSEEFRAAQEDCCSWLARKLRPLLTEEILEHQSTTPIDSAIGNLLYKQGADLHERVRNMVLLGYIGDKFKKKSEVMYFVERVNKLFQDNGRSPYAFFRTAGRRVMHYKKPEWIYSPTDSVFNAQNNAYTKGVQFRARLVYAEGQYFKALFKRPADILKNIFFKLTKTNSTDASYNHRKVRRIGELTWRYDMFDDRVDDLSKSGCLTATDAVGWDRTIAFSNMKSGYIFLRKIVPDLPECEYFELIERADTIIPDRLSGDIKAFAYHSADSVIASGEAWVTAKNNAVHTIMYYIALHICTGLSWDDIYNKFQTGEWILCVHGDDLLRWFGTDKSLYYKIDEWFKVHTGVHNEYELVPVFLKKYVDPDLCDATDFGGAIRNILGEYPKNFSAVTAMGVLSRLASSHSKMSHEYLDSLLNIVLRIIGEERYITMTYEQGLSDAQLRLQRIAPLLSARATQFRQELESFYYSNYESLPDTLATLYGQEKVDYVNSEYAKNLHGKTIEQLTDMVCELQQQIFDNAKYRV